MQEESYCLIDLERQKIKATSHEGEDQRQGATAGGRPPTFPGGSKLQRGEKPPATAGLP